MTSLGHNFRVKNEQNIVVTFVAQSNIVHLKSEKVNTVKFTIPSTLLDIMYIFAYYIHFMRFRIFKFPVNA